MDSRRGIAQIIAGGAALAAAYEIREGFFEGDLVLFAVFVVMHATMVVMSVMMFLRAWREIEEFDGPLRFARMWYVLSDVGVILGLYGIAFSRSKYSVVLVIGVFYIWVWVGKWVARHVRKCGWKKQ